MVLSLLLASLAACGATPAASSGDSVPPADVTASPVEAPTDTAPKTAAEFAQVPSLATSADLDRWMKAPCFAFSDDKRELACVEAMLDMGFVNARIAILSVDGGKEVASHTVYEGPSELDADKMRKDSLSAANAQLQAGRFVEGGKTITDEKVVSTPDGYFRIELPTGNMMGKRPSFSKADGPDGFGQDPAACMSWTPSGGVIHRYVTALRITSTHRFTKDAGPCMHTAELTDETFPARSRWLVLRAK